MKKISLFILMLVVSLELCAQKSFQDQLAVHGENAVYQRYFSVYLDDDGNQKIANAQGQFTISPNYFGKIPSGFQIISTGDEVWEKGEVYVSTDATGRYYNAVGHPEVSHYLHTGDRSAWVAMDDYVIKLGGMSKDGTTFSRFETIYILQDDAVLPAKEDAKKKKGFLSKLKDFKEAVKNGASGGSKFGPAYERVVTRDLRTEITAYLKQMKSKQASLTGAQKAEAKKLVQAKEAGEDYVKRYNDSLYNSPEQRRIRADWKLINGATNVEVKNNSGRTLFVSQSADNFISQELKDGQSYTMDCRMDLYYFSSSTKNASGKKFYSADSSCGSSISIN